MKIKLLAIATTMCALSAGAQDIYLMERLSSSDLSGTAGSIAMGGAVSALGGDISAIHTNPGSIAMFRKPHVSASFGLNNIENGTTFDDIGKTRMSFDQVGFVYPFKLGDGDGLRYVNVGFNYNKTRNLHSLVGTRHNLDDASQTWQMADMSSFWGGTDKGSPLTNAGYQTYLFESAGTTDEAGYDEYNVYNASQARYNRATTGGIHAFDINTSLNFSDRLFLGFTVGLYNVDANSFSEYAETLDGVGGYTLTNDRSLSGTGVDFKFGAVGEPFEDGTLRLGFSFSTPTYFTLTDKCTSLIRSRIDGTDYDYRTNVTGHDYNIQTPWKFNVSAGGTLADFIALGIEYEYADLSTAKVSYDDIDDGWWDSGSTTKDRELNRQASRYLKGVSTLRLGAEVLAGDFSIRGGYNYVSSPMKNKAFLNQFINSASLDYSTSTDYMNLGDINRYTCGFSFSQRHFTVDLAYAFETQTGKFYPFSTQQGNDANVNDVAPAKVKLDRNRFVCTFAYQF